MPAATIVAENSPLPASLAGRTGRVPVTAPSRWQLLHKSMWLSVSQSGLFGSRVMEIHSSKLRPRGGIVNG